MHAAPMPTHPITPVVCTQTRTNLRKQDPLRWIYGLCLFALCAGHSTLAIECSPHAGRPSARFEAEEVMLEGGMEIQNEESASAWRCITATTGNQAAAKITAELPQGGRLGLWCLVKTLQGKAASLSISIDAGSESSSAVGSSGWEWVFLMPQYRESDVFSPEAPRHTFTIRG